MENNCQDCGCKDTFLPVAPCSDPAQCPSPEKCEETFDSACVIYTGLDLNCGNDTIVGTNDTVEKALQSIVAKVCELTTEAFDVTITPNENDSLQALVSNGTAPYTFLWTVAQGLFTGYSITPGSGTSAVLYLTPVPGETLQVGGISGATGAVRMVHLKLEVTDGNLNKVVRYFTYTNLV